MKNILVTGASGQLGQAIRSIAVQYPDFNFVYTDRQEIDVTNTESVADYFIRESVDACINCAAYTAVDKAEQEEELAFRLNFEAVLNLAQACQEHNATFLHISTDYVFDGKHFRPYTENDEPNPTSIYGASKLRGEAAALGYNPDTIVIRTAWLYSEFGMNFAKRMKELMAERPSLNIVFDQIGTPTYAVDLAQVIVKMLAHKFEYPESKLGGVYHFSNEGVTSWYDFAVAIKSIIKSDCVVLPITSAQYPTPAERPAYSVFNKEKIKTTLGIEVPYWLDSLKMCLSKL